MSNDIWDKFNNIVMKIVVFAKAASINAKVNCLYPESFMVGILSIGENSVTSYMLKQNIDLEHCLKEFTKELELLCAKYDLNLEYLEEEI